MRRFLKGGLNLTGFKKLFSRSSNVPAAVNPTNLRKKKYLK